MRGWRAVLTDRYDPAGNWDSLEIDELHAELERAHVHDPPTQEFVAGPYVTRVRDRRDVVPDRDNDTTPSGVHLRKLGFSERIVVATPVTSRAEIFVGFDRLEGSPGYTESDRALLHDAIPALTRHGRSLALMFGLVGDEGMLTLRERQVLRHLLHGASEAEAAFAIGMSKRNCHQRVVRIYRQLGVSSRGELLGCWLSGADRFGVPGEAGEA